LEAPSIISRCSKFILKTNAETLISINGRRIRCFSKLCKVTTAVVADSEIGGDMRCANFTTGQLELLSSIRFRPERFVKSARNPSTGVIEPGFESLAACQAEDRRRASALRAPVQPEPRKRRRNRAAEPPPFPVDPLALAATLETIADTVVDHFMTSIIFTANFMNPLANQINRKIIGSRNIFRWAFTITIRYRLHPITVVAYGKGMECGRNSSQHVR
jgi:hypothetical protein